MLNTDKTEASRQRFFNVHSTCCPRNPRLQAASLCCGTQGAEGEQHFTITHSRSTEHPVVDGSSTTVCEESGLTALRNVNVRLSLKPNAQCNALNSTTLDQQCAPFLLVVARGLCFDTVIGGKSHDLLEMFRILNLYRMSSRCDFITFKA